MKKNLLYLFGILMISTLLYGCSLNFDEEGEKWHHPASSLNPTKATKEDSTTGEKLGVIVAFDTDSHDIKILNVNDNTETVYSYDSSTEVTAKYGAITTIASLGLGDLVDYECVSDTYHLKKIGITADEKAWQNTKVSSFSLDTNTKSLKIGQSLYAYADSTVVISGDDIINITELTSQDELSLWGYDKEIKSIIIEKGHGYISLSGESLFIGGYVDIGGEIVKKIEDDMLILVTEGTYKVEVRNGAYLSEKQATVTRDEQTVVDFSDTTPIVVMTGSVLFNMNAKDAVLYVDESEMDYSTIVAIPIGKHDIRIEANGYEVYEDEIEVKNGYQTFDISMKKIEEETETPSETKPVETQTEPVTDTEPQSPDQEETTGNVSEVNNVTVSGPEGGYIYFDGKYMGAAPVTFPMITGTHVISVLYNSEINSYSVTLAEGGDDVTYDFTDKQ